jgi:hypothetical protein
LHPSELQEPLAAFAEAALVAANMKMGPSAIMNAMQTVIALIITLVSCNNSNLLITFQPKLLQGHDASPAATIPLMIYKE